MERSYSANHEAHPAAPRVASAHASLCTSGWSTPGSTSTLAEQMEDILGEHFEPDPLFFVETWTLGIDAATESLQARHHATSHRDVHMPTPFEFPAPLIFVQKDQPDFACASAGFSSAWKDAYGFSRSSSSSHPVGVKNSVPHDDRPFSTPTSGQPLTPEDACRILGVIPTSTRHQIKSAYRQLAWRYHPDRFEHMSAQEQRIATDRMTSLNEAYHLLCEQPF